MENNENKNQSFEPLLASSPVNSLTQHIIKEDTNKEDTSNTRNGIFKGQIRAVLIAVLILVSFFEGFQLYKLNVAAKENINSVIPDTEINSATVNNNANAVAPQPQAGCGV